MGVHGKLERGVGASRSECLIHVEVVGSHLQTVLSLKLVVELARCDVLARCVDGGSEVSVSQLLEVLDERQPMARRHAEQQQRDAGAHSD